MSDWLKEARDDRDAWNAKLEQLEELRRSTYHNLSPRVRPVLMEAIQFLNEQGEYHQWRFDSFVEQHHIWEIDKEDGPPMFSLRVRIDIQKSLEENPTLVVDTCTGGQTSEIHASEFSVEWLKAKVLESVRYRTPRLP